MNRNHCGCQGRSQDQGPDQLVVNIQSAVQNNTNFRTALWTGRNLQEAEQLRSTSSFLCNCHQQQLKHHLPPGVDALMVAGGICHDGM